MKSIKSSNLESASYNPITKELIVNFRNYSSYKYENVSNELYNQFEETFSGENGKSAGKFFNTNIKNLPCEKLK
ncbi:MAG: KTSC domain-containing protein [Pyrinomonadaceae bacterium]|jgi:hypothetical protein|nr:KTSC domain-containing protein [Pyrinomonadaceae bacterium]